MCVCSGDRSDVASEAQLQADHQLSVYPFISLSLIIYLDIHTYNYISHVLSVLETAMLLPGKYSSQRTTSWDVRSNLKTFVKKDNNNE